VNSASAPQLHPERFRDPATGWEMLGVGCDWLTPDRGPLTLEITYDGVPRLRATVDRVGSAYYGGAQLPFEAGVTAVGVTLTLSGDAQNFTFTVAEISTNQPAAATATPGPRWLSPLRTLGRAVASGEVLRGAWWRARRERYRNFAAKARIKATDRYRLRVHEKTRSTYDAFRAATTPHPAELAAMRFAATQFRTLPTLSVLCPVYNVEPRWLREAVESVLAQAYPHWELCLADDASTDPTTVAALDTLPLDPRIKLVRRPVNGHIVAASNSAAELATGEFVLFLDNDDTLAPQALFRFAEALQSRPELDVIYSDEDKVTADGRHYDPHFKPDWSPELFTSYNYVNHLTAVRRTLFEKAGRFREGTQGAQDWDMLLRVTELTDRVHHVPEVLYHWRALPSSSAASAGDKPFIHEAATKALTDAVRRRGWPVAVGVPPFARQLRLPAYEFDAAGDFPASVAVIVRGASGPAGKTVRAVTATAGGAATTYLVRDEINAADSLNRLAAGRTEEFLLFLEAGVEPVEPGWLRRLLAHARLPGVGAVGGRIDDGRGAIVSAGTVVTDHPRDAFACLTPDPVSTFFLAESTRTVTAPGRGVLLVRRDLFERVGGFDGERFGTSLYDVDFALRLIGQGLRNVHVGGARFRWDATDAGRHDAPTERQRLKLAHGHGVERFHNPNLDPDRPFTLRPTLDTPVRHSASVNNVLFVAHNLSGFEGAPKILADIAIGLHRRGELNASVFAPAPGRGAKLYDDAGVPWHAEPRSYDRRFVDGQWTPLEYRAAVRHLMRVIRRVKPVTVVANTVGMFPAIEATARLGIPAILMVHESYTPAMFDAAFSPFGRERCRRALLLAERVVFGSRTCADLYARLDGRKNFTHLHYGLDRDSLLARVAGLTRNDAVRQLGGDPSHVRVLSVGTVCERKAQHVLVEATALVAKMRRDFRVQLVGAREGLNYLDYVRHLIRARGIEDIVEVVGETDRVPAYFRAADVYACTSHVEAFSLAILEAEAFGLPIISTPSPGLDEQVVWGQNALRFGFDDAATLAAHLERLIGDAELRQRMGRESRAMSDAHPTPAAMLDRAATILAAARTRIDPP
jgi:glycosyltransferase involved in cell wall biosynthesis/GT2 family glycosyltransferase